MARRKKEAVEAKETGKGLHEYELVFILAPDAPDESVEGITNSITQFISGKDGVIVNVEQWGKKKLAYPIKHSSEGNYVLVRFQMSPAFCQELEASLEISEDVLRHLLIRLDS